MRKIIIAALAFVMMTCIAFAEGENGDNSGRQGATFDISLVEMTLDQPEYEKTGSEIKPVKLTYDGAELDAEVYPYTLDYTNNINVGTATATVVFSDTLFPEGTAPCRRSGVASCNRVAATPRISPCR